MRRVAKLKGQRWNVKKVITFKKHTGWNRHKIVRFAICPVWKEVYRLSVQREAPYLSRLPVASQFDASWNVRYRKQLKADSFHHERKVVAQTGESRWGVHCQWILKSKTKFSICAAQSVQRQAKYNAYICAGKCAGSSWDTLQNPAGCVQSLSWLVRQSVRSRFHTHWKCAGLPSVQASLAWNVQHLNVQAGTSWGVKSLVCARAAVISNTRLTLDKFLSTLWHNRRRLWIRHMSRYKVFRPVQFVEQKGVKRPNDLRGGYLSNSTVNRLDKKKRLQLGIK